MQASGLLLLSSKRLYSPISSNLLACGLGAKGGGRGIGELGGPSERGGPSEPSEPSGA